jgi:hypothetical protein
MRTSASWFTPFGPTEYKVAARCSAPTASSPRHRHPDQKQRAIVLAAVKTKPSAALTGPVLTAAVRAGAYVEQPGRENAPLGRTREWTEPMS